MHFSVELFLQQFVTGLSSGLVLFILASGLALIFSVLGVLNFAHGSFYMMGAFTASTIVVLLGKTGLGFWPALVLGPFVIAALGWITEVVLLRRLYPRGLLYQLLLTYALILVFLDGTKAVWGPSPRTIPRPSWLEGWVSFGGANFPSYSLFLIVMGVFIYFLLVGILKRTRLGLRIRAAASCREMVSALGIDTPRLFSLVFIIGCWLAGVAGVLAAPVGSVSLGMDGSMIIKCFIVIVVGGMGSIFGALIGALIIGLVEAFAILLLPQFSIVCIYIIMALVLLIRPWGICGKPLIER